MTETTNLNLKKIDGSDNWRTIFLDHNESMEILDSTISNKVIMPSSPISIPLNSQYYDLEGITANHVVFKWQFSQSAENTPPCNLTIETFDGYFRLDNDGGSTNETVQPIFIIPTAVQASANNSL